MNVAPRSPGGWLLLDVRVIDPATSLDARTDLFVPADGSPVRHAEPGDASAADISECAGLVAAPAFVELHAHLREPGGEESETIATGLAAARAGGYGHVLAMANTKPVNDDPAVTRRMLDAARASATGVELLPVTAATLGLGGRACAPWAAQNSAGCVAISDDGKPVADHAVLAQVLAGAAALGIPYLSHAECPCLFTGPIHDGDAARAFGVQGIPTGCESRAVEAELALAEREGAAIHVCHLSTADSIRHLRAAKARGVRASAEATPHHLLLTDEEFLRRGPDTSLKMNPPLRPAPDRDAVVAALFDGTIEAIGTDHAPHAPHLKAKGLADAPFGAIGMETAFAVLHDRLVLGAGFPLADLVRRMTTAPAAIARIGAGRLFSGRPAVVLIAPDAPWRVDASRFRSKSRNCPFDGWEGRGRVLGTWMGGTWAASPA
ncbi:MAG: Dihydroorotase [Planctomycetes bacterium]|nr:Dihydroorotase [Planctomycetota bacterium]